MIPLRLLAAFLLAALPGLAPAQVPPRAPEPPALALPANMSRLPNGAWRLAFPPADSALPQGSAATLATIGRYLAALPPGTGRITVEGHASGPADDASLARRLSLARALAVREALTAGGIEETRIDVRALGHSVAALDVADILPPGTPRSGQTR